MTKFNGIWYNESTVVKVEDVPVEANNLEEAKRKFYERYNGNPPAPLLSIIPSE